MDEPNPELREFLVGLFVETAIIEHLVRNRADRVLGDGLAIGHIGVLNYFSRNHHGPDSIAGIAWSFQEEENYTASKVGALEQLGFVTVTPPGSQTGNAMVEITRAGKAAQEDYVRRMAPEILPLVAEIPEADLITTHRTLREIRLTLDNLPDR